MSHPEPVKSIEQVVQEVGRYPLSAFIFIQECVGAAAEQVHGPLTPDQTKVVEWLNRNKLGPDDLRALHESGRLPSNIASAVRRLGGLERMNRHVTGQQLCGAIRDIALTRWGLLAREVLARWNIQSTEDIGHIIFALVNSDWLQKQPTDVFEDFINVFSFEEAFDDAYQIQMG